MPRYELVEGTSSKFWEISLDGASFTVRYGRIGTDGQSQTKSFATAEAAQTEHDKLVREKTKKGYAAVDAEGAAVDTEPAPALPRVKSAPAAPPPASAAPPPAPAVVALEAGWVDAGGGYALSVLDDRIVARNTKGKVLGSVPKDVREGEPYQALADALELLETHARDCREAVEGWMLRSLPVPAAVVAAVWPDPAWRGLLENTVVATPSASGLLRGVGPRGLGVVTLDGAVTVPHPMLLAELDDWRGLLAELALAQVLPQLFRETFPKPADGPDEMSVEEWSGGEFELLASAMNEARKGGWRVRAGSAVCAILEGGRLVEARYDLGEGDPMYETTTGSLSWSDPDGATLRRGDVGPVAWSEGMRMAAAIYKKRKVEEKEDEES
jgi:predicted DNA-binding WGR domain protein